MKDNGTTLKLTAAECAERIGLTVRALRVYERHGLLCPRRTDKNWRLYGVEDLARLNEILALKRFGLSLAGIADLLAGKPTDIDRTLAMLQAPQETLRHRVEGSLILSRALRQRIAAGEAVSVNELITIAKETSMTNHSTDTVAWRRYEQARPRSEGVVDPALYDLYAGSYQFEGSGCISIGRRADGLTAQVIGQSAFDIYPEKEDAFFCRIVPAQITFIREAGQPAGSLVLHQDGYELKACRIDQDTARGLAEELENRIKNRIPVRNSEALLLEFIEEARRGSFNYDRMSEALAAATREQSGLIKGDVERAGALKGLAFKGVSPEGWDVYDVEFENSAMEWSFVIGDDDKLSGAFIRMLP
jgi:DNA-binding transcriptional MerR regulator